jgi:hypothetical protein
VITFNVSGSIASESDLADVIREGLARHAERRRNWRPPPQGLT